MKKRIACLLTLSGLLFAGSAAAEGFGLGVKAGTLGLGIEGTFAFSEHFSLRAGINNYSYDFEETASDIQYNTELDLKSGALLLDWHPFAGVFRVSAGYVRNKNALSLRATPTTSQTIGDTTYTPAEIGTLSGDVTFKKNVPYFGIGWGNAARGKGFGFSAELGAVLQDKPNVALRSDGTLAANAAFQADLREEEQEAQQDLDDFDTYPVVSFGVSYSF